MNPAAIRQIVTPLRLVFWGALIEIFDLSITLGGSETVALRFDLLDDTLGAILVAIGVFRLSTSTVHQRYATWMRFAKVMSVIAVVTSVRNHFIVTLPPIVEQIFDLLYFVNLLAIIAFCVCMRWFCELALWTEVARSWTLTIKLLAAMEVVAMAIFIVWTCCAVSGRPTHLDIGAGIVPVVILVAIPFVHFFMSLWRMQTAAAAVV